MKNSVFSHNLKTARKLKGWSQGKASEVIRIKRPTYAAYEEGRSTPRQMVLIKICKVFEVDDLKSFLVNPRYFQNY